MRPTIQPGDRILVNKIRADQVTRGALVVFREPVGGRAHVKRIIGLPGDRVEIESGVVRVNGEIEQSDPGAFYRVIDTTEGEPLDVVVPAGRLFFLGDNRGLSRDSRHFGTVPAGNVVGVVEYVYGSRIGTIR